MVRRGGVDAEALEEGGVRHLPRRAEDEAAVELEAARLAARTVGKKYDFLSAWRASTALCTTQASRGRGAEQEGSSDRQAAAGVD